MLFSNPLGLVALLQLSTTTLANPVVTTRDDKTQAPANAAVNTTTCNGKKYVYEELAGWGILPSDARDKFGDTIGGIGSAIALEKNSWKKIPNTNSTYTLLTDTSSETYSGILYGLPDRGWNTEGTQNTQSRIHKFTITLTTVPSASLDTPAPPNVHLTYLDTILLTGPDGAPTTGLDADTSGALSYPGFPDLPAATYTGDGFGNPGPGGRRIAIDTEGLVLAPDGGFWISDEYGPYVYRFDATGKMVSAVRPPNALVPRRNGTVSFNAASPPIYDPERETVPEDPDSGRANNQGLEGLTADPSGEFLYALLQSATMQEGGKKSSDRRYTRLLQYKNPNTTYETNTNATNALDLVAEFIVPLPLIPSTGKVAGQSELHFISPTQFLILARDSNAGRGQDATQSVYRNADVFDISRATNIKSSEADEAPAGAVASKKGKLDDGVTAAEYCPWLSYNNNEQLGKFGAHNGGAQDGGLLDEKWESFALARVHGGDDDIDDMEDGGGGEGQEFFLLSVSDNDFVTQNGFINAGRDTYKDGSGFSVDTQVLVFRVRLPDGVEPLV